MPSLQTCVTDESSVEQARLLECAMTSTNNLRQNGYMQNDMRARTAEMINNMIRRKVMTRGPVTKHMEMPTLMATFMNHGRHDAE